MSRTVKWVIFAVTIGVVVLALLIGTIFFLVFRQTTKPLGERFDDPVYLSGSADNSFATLYLGSENLDEIHISCETFNGVKDVRTMHTAKGEQVTVSYTAQVDKGRMKLILVLPDRSVIDLSEQENPYSFAAPEGKLRLRVVGDMTGFTLDVKIDRQK